MAPAVRAIPSLFRIATACMLLAAVALVASLIVVPPPILTPILGKILPDGWPWLAANGPAAAPAPVLAAMLALLPQLAALLGLLAAGLGLYAGAVAAARVARPASPAAPATGPASAGPHILIQELRGLLAEERGELANLRELCGTATHDAMMVGARLAGVALDAETRLAAGVTLAEQVLHQHPADFADRAAEAVLRVERTLPELTALIRRGVVPPSRSLTHSLADSLAHSEDAQDGAENDSAENAVDTATRLAVVVDDVVRNFGVMMTQAAEQVAALGDIATRLRRDAAALDTVGREVAMAGASVVTRVGNAAAHADWVLAKLPAAAAMVAGAADQAAQTLVQFETAASSAPAFHALASSPTSSRSAAYSTTQDEAGARLVMVVDSVAQTLGGLMTEAADQIAVLGNVADGLRRDVIALDTAGRGIALAGASVVSRVGDAVAQASAALAQLPAAAAMVSGAADQAARTLADTSAVLRADAGSLEEGARAVSTAGEKMAAQTERLVEAAGHVETQAALLPGAVAAVVRAAGGEVDLTRMMEQTHAMEPATVLSARTEPRAAVVEAVRLPETPLVQHDEAQQALIHPMGQMRAVAEEVAGEMA